MRILVVLAHPDPTSFNQAIAQTAVDALQAEGHAVIFHDLYAEGYDPVLTVPEIPKGVALDPVTARHCAELAEADGIIVIHPNWWGQPPAVLKGWIDRVFRPGVAYEFREGDGGEGVPIGLLKARCTLVFNTSNTPAQREREAFGDPLETLWRNCLFGLCGVKDFRRRMFGVIVTSTPAERETWLGEVRRMVREAFT